jgi:hypothetical protein
MYICTQITTKKIEIMKASVKNTNYEVGKKVYFSEGIEDKYFRGIIIKSLKTSVNILNKENKIETIEKRNLGIII